MPTCSCLEASAASKRVLEFLLLSSLCFQPEGWVGLMTLALVLIGQCLIRDLILISENASESQNYIYVPWSCWVLPMS